MWEIGLSTVVILGVLFASLFSGCWFVGQSVLIDGWSFSMVTLSLVLSLMLLLLAIDSAHKQVLSLLLMLVVCLFFLTDSLLWFFILFEVSLIPLILMMMSWGTQPERFGATVALVMYTLVFSFPLFYTVAWGMGEGLESMALLSLEGSMGFSWTGLLAFFVKIPVFLFHSWLPKAHVEAPLEGSVVLAGVMLKLGVYGLIRFVQFVDLSFSFSMALLSLSLVGSCLSAAISISSDDMKMSVAYSSISHMNFILSSVMTGKVLALKGALIVSVAHGLSSPLLFFLVTKLYKLSHSRSVLVSKGVLAKYPLMSFFSFILWAVNLSAPPFLAFLGELIGIVTIYSLVQESVYLILFYVVVSSFFSMLMYGVYSHSSLKLHIKSNGEGNLVFSLVSSALVFVLLLMFFNVK